MVRQVLNEPRAPASDERGPVLFTNGQCVQWKERIEKEVDTAARLKHMIQKNQRMLTQKHEDRGPPKCMPVPPTTFALAAAKFKNEDQRIAAARSVKYISTEWPQSPEHRAMTRSLSKESFHSMFSVASPHHLTSRPTPWR